MKTEEIKNWYSELKNKQKLAIQQAGVDPSYLTDIFGRVLCAHEAEAIDTVTGKKYDSLAGECYPVLQMWFGSIFKFIRLHYEGRLCCKNTYSTYKIEFAYDDEKKRVAEDEYAYFEVNLYYSALQDAAKELTKKS